MLEERFCALIRAQNLSSLFLIFFEHKEGSSENKYPTIQSKQIRTYILKMRIIVTWRNVQHPLRVIEQQADEQTAPHVAIEVTPHIPIPPTTIPVIAALPRATGFPPPQAVKNPSAKDPPYPYQLPNTRPLNRYTSSRSNRQKNTLIKEISSFAMPGMTVPEQPKNFTTP